MYLEGCDHEGKELAPGPLDNYPHVHLAVALLRVVSGPQQVSLPEGGEGQDILEILLDFRYFNKKSNTHSSLPPG